ncbi:Uncharacterized protein (Fragment) [Durusdinium trenchii]|uniref:PDZ domain-containing protein n=1 Tax=Durusdinium trenchii TaxID=1381693 RepID=A0ABP0R8T5_9DINO
MASMATRGLARWQNVLRPEVCRALRAEAITMLQEVSRPSLRAVWHNLQRWLLDPIREPKARHILRTPLTRCVRDGLEPLALLAAELGLRPSARLVELNFTISLPGAPAQQPHSDISPMQSLPRIITFWAALQDIDLSMGPTAIWPGSHVLAKDFISSLPEELQKPRQVPEYMYVEGELQAVSRLGQPIGEEELEEERRQSAEAAEQLLQVITRTPPEFMSMEVGDVVAMDCRVFHQGGANISSKTRVLFNASFQLDENYDDSLSCGNQTVSPKIHGFTYHSLPEVLQANYRISDFTDPESLRICTKGLFLQCTGERELKAEIRAAQRLLLEAWRIVEIGSRPTSMPRQVGVDYLLRNGPKDADPPLINTATAAGAPHEVTFKKRPFGIARYAPGSTGTGAVVMEVTPKSRYPGDPQGQAFVAGVQPGWVVKSVNGQDVTGIPFEQIMESLDDEVLDPVAALSLNLKESGTVTNFDSSTQADKSYGAVGESTFQFGGGQKAELPITVTYVEQRLRLSQRPSQLYRALAARVLVIPWESSWMSDLPFGFAPANQAWPLLFVSHWAARPKEERAHLQFMLRMGSVEHGPLECIFDRPEKDCMTTVSSTLPCLWLGCSHKAVAELEMSSEWFDMLITKHSKH